MSSIDKTRPDAGANTRNFDVESRGTWIVGCVSFTPAPPPRGRGDMSEVKAWKDCPTCGGTHKWVCNRCGFGVAGLVAPATHKDERGKKCDVEMRPCVTCRQYYEALESAIEPYRAEINTLKAVGEQQARDNVALMEQVGRYRAVVEAADYDGCTNNHFLKCAEQGKQERYPCARFKLCAALAALKPKEG